MSTPAYAELHCLSNFSFQRGASSASELFQRAARLGYRALAITDECSMAGMVRAWQASKDSGLPLIVGTEIQFHQGPKVVLLAESLPGYQRLCQLITLARRRAAKGHYQALLSDLVAPMQGVLAIWLPRPEESDAPGHGLRRCFPERLWLGIELHCHGDDAQRLQHWLEQAARLEIPALACGDVHMHSRGRRALQDCMTAIRQHLPVADAGAYLFANGERHLRRQEDLAQLYPSSLLAETLQLAERCRFGLDQLQYQYPHELVPQGHDSGGWLRELVCQGADWRWPKGPSSAVQQQLEHELSLIIELGYESYFLTVYDIVRFAREQGILCQGRGSAANSAVCYALGITEIDPSCRKLLFERFISRERHEPPDIDVDFEHERREEVIQYIFRRYGRRRAALTAVVNTYHAAGAIRDLSKALGFSAQQVEALARCQQAWSQHVPHPERLAEAGFDPQSPRLHRLCVLAGQLIGFPRHLSQHPGGFFISEAPLETLVPVENAAMAERTVIQWDKDDLDVLGLLKVDILALGMLSALRRCFDLIEHYRGTRWTLASLPAEDPDTYAMISRADTLGVFQIESRAQMSMLPRLRPQNFYDLVIEVAIVRPGPIQGDMLHPYLRRRNGEEPVEYPSEALRPVFERTLGVPLFQEQVMELAMVAADYSPGEADQLRRSMAAWKRHGGLEAHRQRLTSRMRAKGYSEAFTERIFRQIEGFGSYGFPESHAASFALLTYASCWLKCHEPAAYACALINSWPMGFYTPDQILQDARRHGIEVRPLDINHSDWDCTLEATQTEQPAIRLGLRLIRGFAEKTARHIEQVRCKRTFTDLEDLCQRAKLDARARVQLADAGALHALVGHRHNARWAMAGIQPQLALFGSASAADEARVILPPPSIAQELQTDYATLGTTLGPHPLSLLRQRLQARRCRSARQLLDIEHGRLVRVAGLVIGRQRPGTAKGVTFITLEDEFGMINVLVWKHLAEGQRRVLLQAELLQIDGHLEQHAGVRHVIAGRLTDLSDWLAGLDVRSRNFQ